jgi:hypothetical protein
MGAGLNGITNYKDHRRRQCGRHRGYQRGAVKMGSEWIFAAREKWGQSGFSQRGQIAKALRRRVALLPKGRPPKPRDDGRQINLL